MNERATIRNARGNARWLQRIVRCQQTDQVSSPRNHAFRHQRKRNRHNDTIQRPNFLPCRNVAYTSHDRELSTVSVERNEKGSGASTSIPNGTNLVPYLSPIGSPGKSLGWTPSNNPDTSFWTSAFREIQSTELPYCITNRLQSLCGVIWYLFTFIKSRRVALTPNN